MPLAQEPDLSVFGDDPLWLVLLKVVFVFAFVLVTVVICIVMERKVLGWMQLRIGPNRHGPWGMLQSLGDAIKLMLKEDIIPKGSDKALFMLAPILAVIPAFMAFAVIPFGPKDDPVSIFGTETVLQVTDLPVAILYVLATSAIAVYGTVLAGWSSGSTYPLLGGVRATAQIISYEVAMGLSFAAVFLYSGSMSTSAIVDAQDDRWFMILLPVSFLIYMVAMIGEAHRPPFDMPESEGDLVGGYLTEYSSIKFAFFMMSEYVHVVTVSGLMVTLFLGGWRAPVPISLWEGANSGWWPMLWFTIKLTMVIFLFVWVRASLPRVRYDQFMVLGWKILIPFALVWLMLVATVRAMQNEDYAFSEILMWVLGGVLALLLISFVVDFFRDRAEQREEGGKAEEPEPPFDPMAGGYPVPPLPGQTLPPVPRRPSRAERAPAGVAADTEGSPEGREGDDA